MKLLDQIRSKTKNCGAVNLTKGNLLPMIIGLQIIMNRDVLKKKGWRIFGLDCAEILLCKPGEYSEYFWYFDQKDRLLATLSFCFPGRSFSF